MIRFSFTRRWMVLSLILALAAPCHAQNQTSAAPKGSDKTLLEIELLTPEQVSDPLLAQRWRKVFEEINEAVRIRKPLPGDEPRVEEISRGPFRLVRLSGELNREGQLKFPGKTFRYSDAALIKEYLNDLKTYGAQGSPAGQPNWGLNQNQYRKAVEQLQTAVDKPVKGLEFDVALKLLPVPSSMPLNFHSSASAVWDAHKGDTLRTELQGLSVGTALAFMLSQQGLGFHPLRTPEGEIELMVYPLTEVKDAWPVGRPIPDGEGRDRYLPGLFAKVETSIPETPLSDVLAAIDAKANVRILVDWRTSRLKQIDLDAIKVSLPRKKTAWALIVSQVIGTSHLKMTYLQDEAGTGFVLLSPFDYYQPRKPDELIPQRK